MDGMLISVVAFVLLSYVGRGPSLRVSPLGHSDTYCARCAIPDLFSYV